MGYKMNHCKNCREARKGVLCASAYALGSQKVLPKACMAATSSA